ncbi:MAG TPA: hypothetical protein VF228_14355, partial [Iamia sp.]
MPEEAAPPSDALGPNAWLVDEMYEQFADDPSSVSESWQEFFAGYTPTGPAGSEASAAAAPAPKPESAGNGQTTKPTEPAKAKASADAPAPAPEPAPKKKAEPKKAAA